MEGYVWPQISAEENPIRYVTNGVHVPTFLAREWANLFNMRFSDWRNQLLNEEYWQCIDEIDDQRYWSLHQSLKSEMLKYVAEHAISQYRRNGCSDALIHRVTRNIAKRDTETLVIGFARRFATYKRATLLFSDPQRLARIVTDSNRPVIFIFAGKAHPSDQPGQHLIKQIYEYSQHPDFQGKIILLEDYDMSLARKLVTGVDVWLNTPEYPLEASGTSGQKAGINGVINLSVLDGWWGEGYNGKNGWAITPHGAQFDADYRNREEANDLLTLLERQVVPLYYQRNGHGYSHEWVRISKASMKSTIPQFNSQRMVVDYIKEYYAPAAEKGQRFMANDKQAVRELSTWKKKVYQHWPKVSMYLIETPAKRVHYDEVLTLRVGVYLNGLEPSDVTVECRVGLMSGQDKFEEHACFELKHTGETRGNDLMFSLELKPELSGLQHYRLRMFPHNPLLSHAFEMGCMICL